MGAGIPKGSRLRADRGRPSSTERRRGRHRWGGGFIFKELVPGVKRGCGDGNTRFREYTGSGSTARMRKGAPEPEAGRGGGLRKVAIHGGIWDGEEEGAGGGRGSHTDRGEVKGEVQGWGKE